MSGIRELDRAFARADKHLRQDMKDALMEAAAPVRTDAQALAQGEITNMREGSPWARMRVGIYRHVAYVAPAEHGARGRNSRMRPKFSDLLLDKAMIRALERNIHHVERRVEHLIDEVANVWERRG